MTRLAITTCLLALICGSAHSVRAQSAAAPEPVMWGQPAFAIPYHWTHTSDPLNARAVELYASSDRGRSWQKISDAQPSVRYFTYRAPSDGEYWFAIRTIDQQGNAWPAGEMQAELRVIVDTTSPQIVRLDGAIAPDGRVTATWQAHDAFLETTSWSLRYRTEAMADWQSVTPNAQSPQSPAQFAGQASWSVPAGTQRVWLQAQVRDQAGNSRESGAVAQLVANANSALTATPFGRPGIAAGPAFPTPQVGIVPNRPAHHNHTTADPFAAAAASLPPSTPPVDARPNVVSPQLTPVPSASQSWPVDRLASSPYERRASDPLLPQFRTTPASSSTQPIGPRTSVNRFVSLQPGEPPQLAQPGPPVPSIGGPADQYVNQLEFEIDYQVDRAGTFGVSKVELWASRDAGRSWQRLAIDSDNVSPIRAQVAEPGDYGLRIVVETAGGLDARTPRPGDRPEMTLRVDTTSPAAELLDVSQGESYFADHLIITWRASDADLADTPISLSYASRPHGPWIPLATGLDNSGRYSWRLQRHLPRQVYIRLEATDNAGNTTERTTPQPIAVALPIPTGQLQAVRGVGR